MKNIICTRVTLIERRENQCPAVMSIDGPNSMMCGEPVSPGGSYCCSHRSIYLRKAPVKIAKPGKSAPKRRSSLAIRLLRG